MSRWWRAYDEALNNPKLQRLPGNLFKSWFNLCCLASKSGGRLPPTADVAFALRITEKQALSIIESLKSAELIDVEGDVMAMHDWDEHQYKSDSSAERMRRHRQRHRDGESDVTVTLQNRTESEQSQNRTERARTRTGKPEGEKTPRQELETILSPERAEAVVDHRKKIRKPLTPHAAGLLAGKFAKTQDPNAAADAMIANGWQGFEPEWLTSRTTPRANGPPNGRTLMDVAKDWIEEDEGGPSGKNSNSNDAELVSAAPRKL